MMEFNNPFECAEYEVFKNTFLQCVDLNVNFIQSEKLDGYWEHFIDFAKNVFKLEIPKEPKPGISVIESKKIETKYIFNYDKASVSVVLGHKGYNSFQNVMQRHLENIITYFKSIEVDKIQSFTYKKDNIFPFHLQDESSLKNILSFVFRSDYDDMIKGNESEKVFKLEKEKKIRLNDECDMLLTMGYDIKNKNDINILFSLSTEYKPIKAFSLSELTDNISKLNKIMFDAFVNMISVNIINIMKGEK